MSAVDAAAAGNVIFPAAEGSHPVVKPVQRPPSPVLAPPQQALVLDALNAQPMQVASDEKDKKLKAQKIFIQSFASEINKIIWNKLVDLLKADPTLQSRLGIKLEKDQSINLQQLLDNIKKTMGPDDSKLAQEEEDEKWVWVKKDEGQELEKIYSQLKTLLAQFDVNIDEHGKCPEFVSKPMEKQLQKAIDDYVNDKFNLMNVAKKSASVGVGILAVLKFVNKINSYGGLTVISDAATAAVSLFI